MTVNFVPTAVTRTIYSEMVPSNVDDTDLITKTSDPTSWVLDRLWEPCIDPDAEKMIGEVVS